MSVLELKVETEVGKKERDRDRETDRRPMAEIWWEGRKEDKRDRDSARHRATDREGRKGGYQREIG